MKKTIFFSAIVLMALTLSSCGIGINDKASGEKLAKAISTGNLQEAIALDPGLASLYRTYITSPEKLAKVNAFLVDISVKMEKQDPGTLPGLLLMLNSGNNELIGKGASIGLERFTAQVLAYAGTLDPEKVFNKIFTDY